MLCYAMPCCAMPCHAMPCHAMLCYDMLCYAMLCYAMLCYAMLCYAMLCYAMLCYAMLCYAMLCYAMLCYAMLCYARLGYTEVPTVSQYGNPVLQLLQILQPRKDGVDAVVLPAAVKGPQLMTTVIVSNTIISLIRVFSYCEYGCYCCCYDHYVHCCFGSYGYFFS